MGYLNFLAKYSSQERSVLHRVIKKGGPVRVPEALRRALRGPGGGEYSVAEGRPYTALDEVIYEVARKRNVRGPHRIHNYMKARLGESVPSWVSISKWM